MTESMLSAKSVDLQNLPKMNHIVFDSAESKEEKTSPLAMLAKTCQNIGMDTTVKRQPATSTSKSLIHLPSKPQSSGSNNIGQKRSVTTMDYQMDSLPRKRTRTTPELNPNNNSSSLIELMRLSKLLTSKALQETTNRMNNHPSNTNSHQHNQNNSVIETRIKPNLHHRAVDTEENNNSNDSQLSSILYWMENIKKVDEKSQIFYQMLLNDCLDQMSNRPKPKFCIYCGQKIDNQFNLLIHIYSHTTPVDIKDEPNIQVDPVSFPTRTSPTQRSDVQNESSQINLSQALYYLFTAYNGLTETNSFGDSFNDISGFTVIHSSSHESSPTCYRSRNFSSPNSSSSPIVAFEKLDRQELLVNYLNSYEILFNTVVFDSDLKLFFGLCWTFLMSKTFNTNQLVNLSFFDLTNNLSLYLSLRNLFPKYYTENFESSIVTSSNYIFVLFQNDLYIVNTATEEFRKKNLMTHDLSEEFEDISPSKIVRVDGQFHWLFILKKNSRKILCFNLNSIYPGKDECKSLTSDIVYSYDSIMSICRKSESNENFHVLSGPRAKNIQDFHFNHKAGIAILLAYWSSDNITKTEQDCCRAFRVGHQVDETTYDQQIIVLDYSQVQETGTGQRRPVLICSKHVPNYDDTLLPRISHSKIDIIKNNELLLTVARTNSILFYVYTITSSKYHLQLKTARSLSTGPELHLTTGTLICSNFWTIASFSIMATCFNQTSTCLNIVVQILAETTCRSFQLETSRLLHGLPILIDQIRLTGQPINCNISRNGVTIIYADGRLDYYQLDLTPIEIFLIEILPSIEQNIVEAIKLEKAEPSPWIHISKFMEIVTLLQTQRRSLIKTRSRDHFFGSQSSGLNQNHQQQCCFSSSSNSLHTNLAYNPTSSSILSVLSMPEKTSNLVINPCQNNYVRQNNGNNCSDLLGSLDSLEQKLSSKFDSTFVGLNYSDDMKLNSGQRKPLRKLNANYCKTLPCLVQDQQLSPSQDLYPPGLVVHSDTLADPLNSTAIANSMSNFVSANDFTENIPPPFQHGKGMTNSQQRYLCKLPPNGDGKSRWPSNNNIANTPSTHPKLIRKVFMNTNSFGSFGDENYKLKEPNGIVTLSDGTIIISDGNAQAIKFFSPNGKFLFSWQTQNTCHSRAYPTCLAYYDPGDLTLMNIDTTMGGLVVVLRRPHPTVKLFTLKGRLIREICSDIDNPKAVCVDMDGKIIILESHVMLITIHTWIGVRETRFFCPELQFPMSVSVDCNRRIYIADNLLHYIFVYNYNGQLLSKIGGPGVTNYPISVCYLTLPTVNLKPFVELENKRTTQEFIVVVDNHTNLNVTVFNLSGKVVFAMQSIKKHSQIFAATLDLSMSVRIGSSCPDLNNIITKNSLLFTSKDYHVYRYPLPNSFGNAIAPPN